MREPPIWIASSLARRSSPGRSCFHQPDEVRRHERGAGRSGALYQRAQPVGLEPASKRHGGAAHEVGHQDDLSDRPKRAYIEEGAVGPHVKGVGGVLRHRHQVTVQQHRGLWRTGSAAAEVQRCQFVAVALRWFRVGSPLQQRLVVMRSAQRSTDADDPLEALDIRRKSVRLLAEACMDDEGADARIPQQCNGFGTREAWIEGYPDEACGHGAVVSFEILPYVRKDQGDPVAAAQAESRHGVAEPIESRTKRPVRPWSGVVDDRHPVWMPARQLTQLPANMHVHQPLSTTRPATDLPSTSACPLPASGNRSTRSMQGLTALFAIRCSAR